MNEKKLKLTRNYPLLRIDFRMARTIIVLEQRGSRFRRFYFCCFSKNQQTVLIVEFDLQTGRVQVRCIEHM